MPSTQGGAAMKQRLTLSQLASYDDILTDALVDHAFYWTAIPKNRNSYRPSRGVREDQITSIIQKHLIVEPDVGVAESKLLATNGLKRCYDSLKTPQEKEDFRSHLRRYMSIYLPDCPWEVNATNRYTIGTLEASVTARRYIRRNETISYLSGIQVIITPEEEREMTLRKKDFSIIVSSRRGNTSLFMGPARFANHDCDANARLVTRGRAGIEIIACRNIEVGDEITVSYSENYFGEDNCECLCQTCELHRVNGWKPGEDETGQDDMGEAVRRSIERDASGRNYSLRRRPQRDDSTCGGDGSRTPSVAPDIRPRVRKCPSSRKALQDRASTTEPSAMELRAIQGLKRKAGHTPPVTPSPVKKLKTTHLKHEITPISLASPLSRSASFDMEAGQSPFSLSSEGLGEVTDVTTPEGESPEPVTAAMPTPEVSPVKEQPADVVCKLRAEDHAKADASPEHVDGAESCKIEGGADQIWVQDLPAPLSPAPAASNSTGYHNSTSSSQITRGDHKEATRMVEGLNRSTNVSTSEFQQHQDDASVDPQHAVPSQAAITHTSLASESMGVAVAASLSNPPGVADTAAPTSTLATCTAGLARTKSGRVSKRKPVRRKAHPRVPGDYTLTPRLLSTPAAAWVHCLNCNAAFVQHDAYYTRASCPRCERHSKLYGYVWPKTAPLGPMDKEERVLDHRTVHRFLGPEEEAKVRGRKSWQGRLDEERSEMDKEPDDEITQQAETRGRVKTTLTTWTASTAPTTPASLWVPGARRSSNEMDRDGDRKSGVGAGSSSSSRRIFATKVSVKRVYRRKSRVVHEEEDSDDDEEQDPDWENTAAPRLAARKAQGSEVVDPGVRRSGRSRQPSQATGDDGRWG